MERLNIDVVKRLALYTYDPNTGIPYNHLVNQHGYVQALEDLMLLLRIEVELTETELIIILNS